MGIAEAYHYYWTEQGDPRVKGWLLMDSIFPMMLIIGSYYYFVNHCGPRYMKNRPAYTLMNFSRLYNVFQIIVNTIIVKELVRAGWFSTLPFTCVPMDYSDDPVSVELLKLMWWTMTIKLTDLVETVVFVLRKKHRQISFLHLYHHISTLLLQWIATKYVGGVMASFMILINSSVHVIMYTYYLLSTYGPNVQKMLQPIKPMITMIQMIQFCVFIAYMGQGFLPGCPLPRLAVCIGLANVLINFVLFYNFYQKNYTKPKKT